MEFELREIDDKLQELASTYMLTVARMDFIPLPDFNDEAMWQERYDYKILSNIGINFIQEKRNRLRAQTWSTYGSMIGILTGFLGACAAVLALLK